MPSYDPVHFRPPAPLALVMLRNPSSGASAPDIAMLIDTGADVTLLPRAAVKQLGALMTGQPVELIGYNGSRSIAQTLVVQLFLDGYGIEGEFVLMDDSIGILGRDALNHVLLVLDGPKQDWSVGTPGGPKSEE
jgi:predicted aspartyl protease